MTRTLCFAIAVALAVPSAAIAQAPAAVASSGMVTVKVNGLVCDFCIQALTKTFKK
ncbi:MAG: hypothetical protein ACKVOP_05950 [Sphingomonadaceae bacterium]